MSFNSFVIKRCVSLVMLMSASFVGMASPSVAGEPGSVGGSITFILQSPAVADPYFEAAKHYFTQPGPQQTEYIDTVQQSLEDVKRHLATTKSRWSRVNLVVHSIERAALSFPVDAGKLVISEPVLRNRMVAGSSAPLDNTVLDRNTTIRLYSCGAGTNHSLIDALSRYLGGNDEDRPRILASKYYTIFRTDQTFDGRVEASVSFAPFYALTFPGESVPEILKLSQLFSAKFGDVLAWPQVLQAGKSSDFHVSAWPLSFMVSGNKTDLKTVGGLRRYVQRNGAVSAYLSSIGRTTPEFSWSASGADNTERLEIAGRATVVIVVPIAEAQTESDAVWAVYEPR
jgi:hypothetical protein